MEALVILVDYISCHQGGDSTSLMVHLHFSTIFELLIKLSFCITCKHYLQACMEAFFCSNSTIGVSMGGDVVWGIGQEFVLNFTVGCCYFSLVFNSSSIFCGRHQFQMHANDFQLYKYNLRPELKCHQ